VFVLTELEKLRHKINETDERMVGLFIERMALAARIGIYKEEKNLKIYDPAREREIIERFVDNI
jgi:chorismate mutase